MNLSIPDRQRPTNNVLNATCILFAIAAAYLYFNMARTDVRGLPKLAGRVENVYLTNCLIPESRSILPKSVFAFRLDHSPQTLGVYRRSGSYTDLQDSINVGDEVTVYYKPRAGTRIDLDVFQIEKGSTIILNYSSNQHHYLVVSYALGGAAVTVFLVGQLLLWNARYRRRSYCPTARL